MTTTTATAKVKPTGPVHVTGAYPCGFCQSRDHDLCKGTILNAAGGSGSTWTCPCSAQGHTLGGQPPRHLTVTRVVLSARPAPGTVAVDPARARGAAGKVTAVPFPPGVVAPAEFHRLLVTEGVASGTLTVNAVRNWVVKTSPGFPVRHYGPDGTAYDAPQNGPDGRRVTRPGVDVAAGRTWYVATRCR